VSFMLSSYKDRKRAAILAFAGAIPLGPEGMSVHIVGLHKLYLGQWWWFGLYLMFGLTPMPWIAGVIEGLWYLTQSNGDFDDRFNTTLGGGGGGEVLSGPLATGRLWEIGALSSLFRPQSMTDLTDAVRELDRLREEGLISEYEFEQKRRKLLDRIG
jgi:TM2 domain-containing membrane protein YozV